jgi:molybdopterin molybdotransferase
MVNFKEAREIVMGQARSFGTEELRLEEAFGRVLAGQVRADRDYPPFPRATMDGYALQRADLIAGIRNFRILETVFAGTEARSVIGTGECYKIMTGAPVPAGADIVLRREEVAESGEDMLVGKRVPEVWRPFLNIARQGEDLQAGELVIDQPCRCEPAVMGVLATLGQSSVSVMKYPRVALVTTGNEVVEPGVLPGPAQIRNSNRWMLDAALRKKGIATAVKLHVGDDPDELKKTVGAVIPADVLILTGGVSAGDADHVPAVLAELGVKQLFHKIAMRPGKPSYCGLAPGGGIVFALPGNPFSCLVNFALLIGPFLDVCQGLDLGVPLGFPLGEGRRKRTPLDEFFPVRIGGSPAEVTQVPLNGSGDIRMGMRANALVLHPAGREDIPAGAMVDCYLLP